MFDLTPFKRRENGLASFFNEFERNFWPEFFGDDFLPGRWGSFRADITDNGKEYLLEAELPGFGKEDINVEVNRGVLTISANKDETREEKKDNYLRRERRSGRIARSFALDNVNSEDIKAEYKEGVLRLILPKLEPELPKARRIDIN
jgi:HSP20 family protein